MKRFPSLACLSMIGALSMFSQQLSAADQSPDPIATRNALTALLASSNAVLPDKSTCWGEYGQGRPPTVKDLLAMQLAYLYHGENVIEGGCAGQSCTITIRHAGGEDLSSATIEFRIHEGRANPASLRCVITP